MTRQPFLCPMSYVFLLLLRVMSHVFDYNDFTICVSYRLYLLKYNESSTSLDKELILTFYLRELYLPPIANGGTIEKCLQL